MVWIITAAAIAGIPALAYLWRIQRIRRRRKEFLRHLQWALRDTGA